MSRLARYRVELLWAGLLVALPLLAFSHGPARRLAGADTWGTGRSGKKIFFTLVQKLLTDVERRSDRLDPSTAGTLLILGPARYPDAAEWTTLHDWVLAGHTLVVAAGGDDPAVSLGVFGLRVRVPERVTGAGDDRLVVNESLLTPGQAPLVWTSSAIVEGARDDAFVAIRHQGHPVAVAQRLGRGTVVVLASDEIFDNAALAAPDASQVPFRLLERVRAPGKIVFDESLNASGGPKIVGLLFHGGLRPLTLQLVGLIVLFGWMGARAFGPRVTAEPVARRQMTEHAVAFGHLCYKAGAGGRLVAAYVEYFRRELGLLHAARTEAQAAELLARRARLDVLSVRATLARGRATGAGPHAGSAAAQEAIAALAALKQKAEHPV